MAEAKAKRAAYMRAWRAANRDRIRASGRAWAAAHPEQTMRWYRANIALAAERNKAWVRANKPHRTKYEAARHEKNAEHKSTADKVRYHADRAKHIAVARAWQKAHPSECVALQGKRRARKLRATPNWLTLDQEAEIRAWYARALAANKTVDHIVPLQGKIVCGLHVPRNLQLLTFSENASKGNRMALAA